MLIAPVVANTYTHAIGLANGQVHNQAYEVFQQDVTGLVPLRQAILETASSGQSGTVWKLFYSACIVLREYGKLWTGNLSLQCPESIAVGPNNRVVLLDAEVQISGYRLNGNEEAAQTFIHWFGSKGAHGFAQPATASLLHAKALLRFFLEVLHGAQKQASPNVQATLDAVIAELGKINQAQKHTNLQDCEQSIEFMFATDPSFKDWSEQLMGPDVELVETTQKSNRQRPPSKNVFLRLSLLVNLLLLLTLVFLFWPSRRSDGTVLMMSSYCVIFPTQGTISEKVNASLQDLFPGKILDIKPGEAERERLLGEKLTESVKSIEDIEKLHKLLSVLFNKHSTRFKGFSSSSNPDDTVTAIVERGGIFTIASTTPETHGSLLQSDSAVKILKHADSVDKTTARALLENLKKSHSRVCFSEGRVKYHRKPTRLLIEGGASACFPR